MAMRPPARREREELVAYLHGIDAEGRLAHILVHKRGNSIRFAGRLGDHQFTSKSDQPDDWVQEAETLWGLEETIGVSRGSISTPETLAKINKLNVSAVQKRRALGIADDPEEAQFGFTVAA